jgi:hypothetical protein
MGMGVKYGVGSGGFDKINENEGSENELAIDHAYDETDPSEYLSLFLGLTIQTIYVDADEPGNGMLRHRSHAAPLTLPSGTRPRRSASLSDASGGTFLNSILTNSLSGI